jgi:hypothetical protein
MKKFFTQMARFNGIAALFAAALVFALAACSNPLGGEDPEQHTITFDSQGGSAVTAIRVDKGTQVPKPGDPTLDGYALEGWYNAATGGTAYIWPYTLNADVTMYARWVVRLSAAEQAAVDGFKNDETVGEALETEPETIGLAIAEGELAEIEAKVAEALAAYEELSPREQGALAEEKAQLEALKEKVETVGAAHDFLNVHGEALGKTPDDITNLTDAEALLPDLEQALEAIAGLPDPVKALLTEEIARLESIKEKIDTLNPVAYTVETDGTANLVSSTAITFNFESTVIGLTADVITVSGAATKSGTLGGGGTSWTLPVTVGAEGNATVSINKTGVENGEKTVAVHKARNLTGSVSIAGTAKVGETLTANTGSLDGTGALSYRWQRGDSETGVFADITGATNQSYALVAADQGKYVLATVSRAEHAGTISSAALGPVAAADLPALTGTVAITGTPKVGEFLTANTGSLGGSGTIGYQWQRGDSGTGAFMNISGGNGPIYTLAPADQGKYLRVTVSRAGNSGEINSAASGPVAAADLTGTVSVDGTAQVGEELTANTGSLGGSGTISYQWQRGAAGVFEDITGGIDQTYVLEPADQGKQVRVTVSREGYTGTKSSDPTPAVVENTLPLLAGTVAITGTVKVGAILTADPGGLSGTGAVSYQWQRSDTAAGGFENIAGATNATYTPPMTDQGKYLRVQARRAGTSGVITSAASGPVAAPDLTGTVAIDGTPKVGTPLTVHTGSLGGTGTLGYRWERSDSAGGPFDDISGAGSQTYTPVLADQGKYLRARVSRAGYNGLITSAAAGPVAEPDLTGTVAVEGTAKVEEVLSANTAGLGGTGALSYQWQRGDSPGEAGTFDDISAANSQTYTLVMADQGKYLRVSVSRAGYEGFITSAASGPVAAPDLTGTVSIVGTAKTGEILTANTALGGTGAISYRWQRGDSPGGIFADISATTQTYTPVMADQGKYLRVNVGRAGYNGVITSAASGPVAPADLTGMVTVEGTAKVGEILSANTTSLDGTGAVSYQWQRGDSPAGTFDDIDAAANETYTLAEADLDKYLRVNVSRAGYNGVITSAASGPVIPTVIPPLTGTLAITGTPKAGETLSADTAGLGGTGAISYRWERSDTVAGGFEHISGAVNASYTLTAADLGKYVQVTVSRADNSGTVSSASLKIPGAEGSFITTWVDEDGTLLSDAPEDHIVISKSRLETLTVTAAAGLGNIKWFLKGAEIVALRGFQTITIEAVSYIPGFYTLSLYAEKDGVPYQINATFVVDN